MERLTAWVAVLAFIGPAVSTGLNFRRNVAVLPHDIYPGYSITKFTSDQPMNYKLLETGFSQFFTVLEDGLVMTTSDLSPLVNRPVNLVVLEETPNSTATHTLQLYVLDRRDMLRFPKEVSEGKIMENSPAGSIVKGLPVLRATGGGVGGLPLRYSILSGNNDGAFALKESHDNSSDIGVVLVTEKPLDKETTSTYTLTIQASDGKGIDKAITKVHVEVLDENDNSPVFTQRVYRFTVGSFKNGAGFDQNITNTWKRFSSVGKVTATDADGDKVAYRLAVPSNLVVIVPQTGDLLLTGDPPSVPGEDVECELTVEAHDLRTPNRVSHMPAQVWLQFNTPFDEQELLVVDDNSHRIYKRRVTRAVRPTKRIEFTEADGETEGRVVFQLEKETERETFKIRDENPWVTVEPNGAVRVKKKWDYEELGPEKTIDFWVTITNAGVGGRS